MERIIAKLNRIAKLIVIIDGIGFKAILGGHALHLFYQLLMRENTY
jgi:hypothetical protein